MWCYYQIVFFYVINRSVRCHGRLSRYMTYIITRAKDFSFKCGIDLKTALCHGYIMSLACTLELLVLEQHSEGTEDTQMGDQSFDIIFFKCLQNYIHVEDMQRTHKLTDRETDCRSEVRKKGHCITCRFANVYAYVHYVITHYKLS
jgi:hypothetical protein